MESETFPVIVDSDPPPSFPMLDPDDTVVWMMDDSIIVDEDPRLVVTDDDVDVGNGKGFNRRSTGNPDSVTVFSFGGDMVVFMTNGDPASGPGLPVATAAGNEVPVTDGTEGWMVRSGDSSSSSCNPPAPTATTAGAGGGGKEDAYPSGKSFVTSVSTSSA